MSRTAINQQTWRDRKRALGLCTRCGQNPQFIKQMVNGIKKLSKCRECLIRNSEYMLRKRMK